MYTGVALCSIITSFGRSRFTELDTARFSYTQFITFVISCYDLLQHVQHTLLKKTRIIYFSNQISLVLVGSLLDLIGFSWSPQQQGTVVSFHIADARLSLKYL